MNSRNFKYRHAIVRGSQWNAAVAALRKFRNSVARQLALGVSAEGREHLEDVDWDAAENMARVADLRAARDSAEAASRAKSHFLASMSHEIRTPMAGILGMTSLLELTEQSDEQKSYTRAIDQSARALLVLLDEILDFSKIEAGKVRLAHQPFAIRDCVQSAVALFQPRAVAKGLHLSFAIASDVPDRALGDSDRVRQIVLNLLSNAIKFTETGTVEVGLSYGRDGDASHFDIVVRDSGVGLSSEMLAVLFVDFEQAVPDRARHPAGTGLGLAISKRLARAMGGDLTAQSSPGRGATFIARLRLDVANPEQQADSKPQQTSSRLWPNRAPDQAPRILIVEDNAVGALMARSVCEHFGAIVEVVTSGSAALVAIQRTFQGLERPFEIVFMDVFLPGIDGFETTRRIRSLYDDGIVRSLRCPPIIALTANAYREDRERCLAAGMNDYLAKPFDAQQLGALLRRWLPQVWEYPSDRTDLSAGSGVKHG